MTAVQQLRAQGKLAEQLTQAIKTAANNEIRK
jgi:hypothetical protein